MISFDFFYSSFKKIFALIILASLLIYGCYSKNTEPEADSHSDFTPAPDTGIRFDFTATGYALPGPKNSMVVEIDAQLFNNNADTVYFLSGTCAGDQYCLVYDETKLSLWPKTLCDSISLVKIAILPNGVHKFRTRFKCLQAVDWIDIGFKLRKVEYDFNTSEKSFDSFIREIKDLPVIGPRKGLVHMREMYY
jgi:hypothetical protein